MTVPLIVVGSRFIVSGKFINTMVTSIAIASSLFPLRVAAAEGDGDKEDWIKMIAKNGKKAAEQSNAFGSMLKDILSIPNESKNNNNERGSIKDLLESGLPGQVSLFNDLIIIIINYLFYA